MSDLSLTPIQTRILKVLRKGEFLVNLVDLSADELAALLALDLLVRRGYVARLITDDEERYTITVTGLQAISARPLSPNAQIAAQRAGCLIYRKARSTGTYVGLYRSAEAGMEDDPELPWSTVCEEHHTLVCHPTRKLAESHLSNPEGWCEECMESQS